MPDEEISEDEPESKPENPETEDVENFPKEFSEEDRDQLLQQYLHYADAALETSSQRIQTNRTFGLILTTILAGLFGLAQGKITFRIGGTILLGAGIGSYSCYAWKQSVDSYRRLNGARYKILNKIEEELPAPLYRDEWRYLEKKQPDPEMVSPRDKDAEEHKSHTIVESQYIRALGAGYVAIGLYALIKLGLLVIESVPI